MSLDESDSCIRQRHLWVTIAGHAEHSDRAQAMHLKNHWALGDRNMSTARAHARERGGRDGGGVWVRVGIDPLQSATSAESL